ncbi:MAG: hypothetical protein RL885_31940 [Planctomycetota bacterium]
MKRIQDRVESFADLGKRFDREPTRGFWQFVFLRLRIKEVQIGEDGVRYPEYMPLDDVIREVLRSIEDEEILLRACARCGDYHDINEAEGIFGNFEALERFLCRDCAEEMSAWEFYNDYLGT